MLAGEAGPTACYRSHRPEFEGQGPSSSLRGPSACWDSARVRQGLLGLQASGHVPVSARVWLCLSADDLAAENLLGTSGSLRACSTGAFPDRYP